MSIPTQVYWIVGVTGLKLLFFFKLKIMHTTQNYNKIIPYLCIEGMEKALKEKGFDIKTTLLTDNKIILSVNNIQFTVNWIDVALTTKIHLFIYREQLLRAYCIKKIYYHLILNK